MSPREGGREREGGEGGREGGREGGGGREGEGGRGREREGGGGRGREGEGGGGRGRRGIKGGGGRREKKNTPPNTHTCTSTLPAMNPETKSEVGPLRPSLEAVNDFM